MRSIHHLIRHLRARRSARPECGARSWTLYGYGICRLDRGHHGRHCYELQ